MTAHPQGPRASGIAAALAAPEAKVRDAMDEIKASALAVVVRYPGSKARHVVPIGHFTPKQRACAYCDLYFETSINSTKKICCTRSCAVKYSWTRPGVVEQRSAAIKKAHSTPEQRKRLIEHNRRRWAKPEEHKKLSEQNRREWADPVKRAKRSASIQAVHGAPEMRSYYKKMREDNWADPEYRAVMKERFDEAKAKPSYRANKSEALRKRWKDPLKRSRLLAGVKKNWEKASERNRKRWADPELRPVLLEKQRAAAAKALETKKNGPLPQSTQTVLDFLRAAMGPMTAPEIESGTGVSSNSVRVALRALEWRALIECRKLPPQTRGIGGGRGGVAKFAWIASSAPIAKQA